RRQWKPDRQPPTPYTRSLPSRLVCSARQVRPGPRAAARGCRGPNQGDGQLSGLWSEEIDREVCRIGKSLTRPQSRPPKVGVTRCEAGALRCEVGALRCEVGARASVGVEAT